VNAADVLSGLAVYVRLSAAANAGAYDGAIVVESSEINPASVQLAQSTISPRALDASEFVFAPDENGGVSVSIDGVDAFTLSYRGRSITTQAPSSTAPVGAGFYTATATVTDPNFTGSADYEYFIPGPLPAADTIDKPADNLPFQIALAELLANDLRITESGDVVNSGLTVTTVDGAEENELELLENTIAFTPSADLVETFAYTVSDEASRSATNTVTVRASTSIGAAEPKLQNIGIAAYNTHNNTTSITHTFQATPGMVYRLSYSTDPRDGWTALDPATPNAFGTFQLTITKPGQHAPTWDQRMFFRLDP
jgi:hypothetical protein